MEEGGEKRVRSKRVATDLICKTKQEREGVRIVRVERKKEKGSLVRKRVA